MKIPDIFRKLGREMRPITLYTSQKEIIRTYHQMIKNIIYHFYEEGRFNKVINNEDTKNDYIEFLQQNSSIINILSYKDNRTLNANHLQKILNKNLTPNEVLLRQTGITAEWLLQKSNNINKDLILLDDYIFKKLAVSYYMLNDYEYIYFDINDSINIFNKGIMKCILQILETIPEAIPTKYIPEETGKQAIRWKISATKIELVKYKVRNAVAPTQIFLN